MWEILHVFQTLIWEIVVLQGQYRTAQGVLVHVYMHHDKNHVKSLSICCAP